MWVLEEWKGVGTWGGNYRNFGMGWNVWGKGGVGKDAGVGSGAPHG